MSQIRDALVTTPRTTGQVAEPGTGRRVRWLRSVRRGARLTKEGIHLPAERVDHKGTMKDDRVHVLHPSRIAHPGHRHPPVADGIAYMQGLMHWIRDEGELVEMNPDKHRGTVYRR